MRPVVKIVAGAGNSAPIVMDHYRTPFNVGFSVSVGGTATYTVQHTFDDVLDTAVTPTWINHPVIASLSAGADGNYAFPVRAIRLSVAGGATGNTVLTLIQAGMPGA